MGRRARTTGRFNLEPKAAVSGDAPDRPLKVVILAGVVGVLVVALAAAAFAFASSTAPGRSGSLPDGTQVYAESDHTHVNGSVTYDHVPPAGGPHNPTQLNCGIYTGPVPNENAVHSMEHGAVWITYRPELPVDQVTALQQLVSSHYVGAERYLVLSPYTGIPSPIVASAWGYQLGVDQPSDPRLVQFITKFAGGGQGGEQGGPCTGGVGNPS